MKQDLFFSGVSPDLLDDEKYSEVPDTMRATTPHCVKTLANIRNGLDVLHKFLKVNEEDRNDNEKLFRLISTPIETGIPFNWDKSILKLMFTVPEKMLVCAEEVEQHLDGDGLPMVVDDFYLCRGQALGEVFLRRLTRSGLGPAGQPNCGQLQMRSKT